jgi:hypothetical protein
MGSDWIEVSWLFAVSSLANETEHKPRLASRDFPIISKEVHSSPFVK